MMDQEKTLVCLRLLRKALFLVRTLKPKVLALLNQANSPAAGCMGAGISASKVRLSNTCIPRRTAAMRRRRSVQRQIAAPFPHISAALFCADPKNVHALAILACFGL